MSVAELERKCDGRCSSAASGFKFAFAHIKEHVLLWNLLDGTKGYSFRDFMMDKKEVHELDWEDEITSPDTWEVSPHNRDKARAESKAAKKKTAAKAAKSKQEL
jgi:hypothetical protein